VTVLDSTPGVTGQILFYSSDREAIESLLLLQEATGHEYGDVLLRHIWGWLDQWGVRRIDVSEHGGPDPHDVPSLVSEAALLASAAPAVDVAPPQVPELTGALLEDVRRVCGVTYAQLARMFGISERAVAGWRTSGVPRHRERTLQAMRVIGLALIGGLGPQGVARWLSDGAPSRLERIAQGQEQEVAAEARRYEFA
jgi:hypothetical protein